MINNQKLLFIVPTRSNVGTNSSLSSIFNSLEDKYDICVLTLNSAGDGTYEFLKKTISIPAVSAYYDSFVCLSGKVKVLSCFVKFLKHISIWLHSDINIRYLKRKIHRFEASNNFDIVVGFQEGQASEVASFFSNPNRIAWVHCDIERTWMPSRKEFDMYSCFRNIVCVSKFTKDKFTSRYPQLEDKTIAIYNLVDSKRIIDYSMSPIDDERFANDDFAILSAGRMDTVKRFTMIPVIAKELKKQNCRFKWYVLGGPENEEFQKIKNLIIENGVESEVLLLGNKSNPYPYFRNSNLYVSTSSSEACPMVFIEAQLCGIPIVTTNFGSSFEFIQNGVNGYIETIDNLWQPICELINNKQSYQKVKSVCENYSIDNSNTLEQLQNLFT